MCWMIRGISLPSRVVLRIVLVFFGMLIFSGGCLADQRTGPDLSVTMGSVVSSEDLYGEFVEGNLQTSIIVPIYRMKWVGISSGVSYLNSHRDIRDYEYNLTQVLIPLRLTSRVAILR